jgi:hypothetical protein
MTMTVKVVVVVVWFVLCVKICDNLSIGFLPNSSKLVSKLLYDNFFKLHKIPKSWTTFILWVSLTWISLKITFMDHLMQSYESKLGETSEKSKITLTSKAN